MTNHADVNTQDIEATRQAVADRIAAFEAARAAGSNHPELLAAKAKLEDVTEAFDRARRDHEELKTTHGLDEDEFADEMQATYPGLICSHWMDGIIVRCGLTRKPIFAGDRVYRIGDGFDTIMILASAIDPDAPVAFPATIASNSDAHGEDDDDDDAD